MQKKLVAAFVLSILLSSLLGVSQVSAETVELKVFMTFPRFQDTFEEYFDQCEQKMKEEQNNDVTIRLEMPHSDVAEQLLKARLASNDAPICLPSIPLPIFRRLRSGLSSDLSDQPFVDTLFEC